MTDNPLEYLEARRERNIRERANRPYFKRVLDEMQNFATSGYQADQTAFHSIHLRPRTRFNEYAVVPGSSALQSDFLPARAASIITRLRIWVRKAMNRRTRRWNDDYHNHYGGFARNMVNRGGWQVNAALRTPTYFGQAIEQFRPHPGTAVRGYDPKYTWTKNQRARLF